MSLQTRDRAQAERTAYRLIYATRTVFHRMRQADFNDSVALGRALLGTLKVGSVDEQITALRSAARLGDGRLRDLVERHVAFITQMHDLQTRLEERVRSLVAELSTAAESDADRLSADALVDMAELKEQQTRLRTDSMANLHDMQTLLGELELERQEASLRSGFEVERETALRHSADIIVRAVKAAGEPIPTEPGQPAAQPAWASPPRDSAPPVNLDRILNDFIEDKRRSKETLKEESINGYRETVELFVERFGDVPVTAITRAVGGQFVDMLKRLPPNRKKAPAYRKMTLQQLLDAKVPVTLAPRTINKHIERLSSLLAWASRTAVYGIGRSPLEGLGVADAPTKNRRGYTEEELARLFGTPEFAAGAHDKPFKFWLPLLGLYTGARLSELAQLDAVDVVSEQGCDCISINEADADGRKSLKSKSAVRKIPVHSELRRLGFMTWVEKIQGAGQKKLFPELPLQDGKGFGHAASKWFLRYRRSRDLGAKELDFHSFRVTFISRLLDQKVEQHQVAELVGHENGLITSNVYWRPDINALSRLVEMVRFPSIEVCVAPFEGA